MNIGETFKDEDGGMATVADTAGVATAASPSATLPPTPNGTPPIPSPPPSPPGELKDKDPPDNVLAFFGHPLTRATNAINGEDQDPEAQAEALFHEYINLPAMDRADSKIGDRLASLIENMRSSDKREEDLQAAGNNVNDYLNILLQTDNLDECFNLHNTAATTTATDVSTTLAGAVTSPTKVKAENDKGPEIRDRLQKGALSSEVRRGAVSRRQSHNLLPHSTAALPPTTTTIPVVRRSDSEPNGATLIERFDRQLQEPYQTHPFGEGGSDGVLPTTATAADEEEDEDDGTDPEEAVLAAAEAAAAAVAISNPSAGLEASLTVTASVVTAPTSVSAPDPDSINTTVVVAGSADVNVPVSLPPVASQQDLGDPVRQTTKDKLKLRIAQTTMTQPLDHGDSQQQSLNHRHHQQQQQHQHQQKGKQGGRQPLPQDPHQQNVYQQYQLHQQQLQQHHQQQQQQQQQQQTPSPSALAATGYLSEESLAAMNGAGKFAQAVPSIKREDQFLDYEDAFPPPYNTSSMQVLYNSVPMATNSGMTMGAHDGMVTMAAINGENSALSEADQLISQMSSEPVFVQSQFLHLLQPLDMGQQQQQQQQMANGYYNANDSLYVYTNNNNNNVAKVDGGLLDLDSDKQTLMRYAQQQQQHHAQHLQHDHYGYGSTYQQYMSTGAGVDTSPDSGISNDPGLSPKSVAMGGGRWV
nr:hypothetical protein BaRGS_020400 [Batillaria attramentaria]